jgi:surfactin synthase thioesterase subunit
MKAILLHHAGGDKYSFRNLQDGLLPEIQSIAVEVPGRGDRFGEPLLNDIHEMTEDIFLQIKNELNEDYFFVGVSMGTLIAYLLCYKIKENNLPLPKHLFLASRLSPDSYFNEPTIIHTGSEEFWKVVVQYNGVPDALMKHQELRDLYEPILRSDFEALEKYNFSHTPKEKLNIPATILMGKEDVRNITMNTAKDWTHHFIKETDFKEFDGGHFFVYENKDLANYIKSTLLI